MTRDTAHLLSIRHSLFALLIDNYQEQLAHMSYTNESIRVHEAQHRVQVEMNALEEEMIAAKKSNPRMSGDNKRGSRGVDRDQSDEVIVP